MWGKKYFWYFRRTSVLKKELNITKTISLKIQVILQSAFRYRALKIISAYTFYWIIQEWDTEKQTEPIYSAVCLTTRPQPLQKSVLHRMRSSVSPFNLHYPLVSLTTSINCLRLLPRLPASSILPSIFISITCLRRQHLRQKWPISLAFLLFYCT